MTSYRNDPAAIRALVRADAVHRDVYLSQEIFDLEMERLWRNTWIYVGHDSQVPQPHSRRPPAGTCTLRPHLLHVTVTD